MDIYTVIMFAWMVEGNEPLNVIEDDPTDNKYLASAIEGEADFIPIWEKQNKTDDQ